MTSNAARGHQGVDNKS